ncbi:MAG: hypothetical protein WC631_01630 [Candidatus Paceibacterota bacterium]|jgi:hypothetical protein
MTIISYGVIALVIGVISIPVAIAIEAKKSRLQGNKTAGNKLTPISKTILIAGSVLGLLIGGIFIKNLTSKSATEVAKVRVKAPREIRWEMWWVKNPLQPGRNPDIVSARFRVEMTRDDEQVFEFTQFYQDWGKEKTSHFYWDKKVNCEYGIWEEASTGVKGRWYLKKIPGEKNMYSGGMSSMDEKDDWAPFFLSGK